MKCSSYTEYREDRQKLSVSDSCEQAQVTQNSVCINIIFAELLTFRKFLLSCCYGVSTGSKNLKCAPETRNIIHSKSSLERPEIVTVS